MNPTNLSSSQLKQAAKLKAKIEKLQKELSKLMGDPGSAIPAPFKRKSGMSAAGRARVAAAQRKRWAKIKAAKKKA